MDRRSQGNDDDEQTIGIRSNLLTIAWASSVLSESAFLFVLFPGLVFFSNPWRYENDYKLNSLIVEHIIWRTRRYHGTHSKKNNLQYFQQTSSRFSKTHIPRRDFVLLVHFRILKSFKRPGNVKRVLKWTQVISARFGKYSELSVFLWNKILKIPWCQSFTNRKK